MPILQLSECTEVINKIW